MDDMNAGEWNASLLELPEPHLLQTWEWAQVKQHFGWTPVFRIWRNADNSRIIAAALILMKTLPLKGFSAKLKIMYVPKGPLLSDWEDGHLRKTVFDDLEAIAKKESAVFLKADPDVVLGYGVPGSSDEEQILYGKVFRGELQQRNWQFSESQIQYRNTVILDLAPSEEEMLARMKQKTRYNIRLAQRKGITVRIGTRDDIDLLYSMYRETSDRDRFLIRESDYYQEVWNRFFPKGHFDVDRVDAGKPYALPYIAEFESEPVAAIIVFHFGKRAWYIYGMSRSEHRNKMPNYLLQWKAIQTAKGNGIESYDLWGAPNRFRDDDPMWGVFRFKQGFGGKVVRTIGAWDFSPHPFWYKVYTKAIPGVLALMKKFAQK